MARETKLQKQEREKAEKMEACWAYHAAYPNRLMEALEKASGFGWDIYVDGGEFKVDTGASFYKFPYAIGLVNWHGKFEEFIIAVEREECSRKRIDRIKEVKKAALGKLSAEEREALGF